MWNKLRLSSLKHLGVNPRSATLDKFHDSSEPHFPDVKWAQGLFTVRFKDSRQVPNGTWTTAATQ